MSNSPMTGNTSPITAKVLFEHIQQSTQAADRMIELLNHESQLLKQRETQQLEALLTEKNQCLADIATGARQRRLWLEQLGLNTDQENWLGLLQENGGQKFLQSWQELNAKLQQCQQLNDVNGKMIARGRQTINRLLDILRGQSDSPKLYTSRGSTQNNNNSNGLVKA